MALKKRRVVRKVKVRVDSIEVVVDTNLAKDEHPSPLVASPVAPPIVSLIRLRCCC